MAFPIKTLLAVAAFAALIPAAQAAEVPSLDVARMCRDSAAADPAISFDVQRCLDSENRARGELAQQWTTFPAADRVECTQTASMGGTASYVELITCLEMNRDARQARASMKTEPSGLRTPQPSRVVR
jgi:hypothetical protein